MATQRTWLDRLWGRVPTLQAAGPDRTLALARALLSERGEASGAAISRELTQSLTALTGADRLAVLHTISESFAPEPGPLRAAAEAYLAGPSQDAAARLHAAAEPPRQELLRRMNMAPGGTAMLVNLRRELLSHLRADAALRPLDQDLLHLLSSWFNRGFLELRRIDWNTPAAILEKLITYEAVHEIDGWPDLRRRLLPDRRCFAFFHPAMPNEPLIFVEVALTTGLANAIQPLLAEAAAQAGKAPEADCAMFYSISNCQEGLRGVSFGNFLIKQVVEELQAELPKLKRFSTLSPVPGFANWLATTDHPNIDGAWWEDEARAKVLRTPLLQACAVYLTRSAQAEPKIDPVARFHLGNGARLERINWLGNPNPRGMRESHGIMVNYLYDPGSIETNHEAFANTGRVVRSSEVDALATPRRGKQADSKAA